MLTNTEKNANTNEGPIIRYSVPTKVCPSCEETMIRIIRSPVKDSPDTGTWKCHFCGSTEVI